MKKYTIALITPPAESHRSSEECLALGYLKSSIDFLLSNTFEVVCVDAWLEGISLEELIYKLLKIENLFCVGISTYMTSLEQVEEIIRAVKSKNKDIKIVAGGYGPTFNQESFLAIGVDFIVVGEGESLLPVMLERFLAGKPVDDLKGIACIKDGKIIYTGKMIPSMQLDSIPFPNREHLSIANSLKNPPHISTSRGCMASCSFCSIASFAKQMGDYSSTKWRQRSIGNIVDEIEGVVSLTGVNTFKIVDDSFIEPPRDEKWIRKFAQELKQRGLKIRFRTQVRADRLSEPIVEALAEAGWFATAIGIENGSMSALKRMGKTASVLDNQNCIGLLKKYGVHAVLNMILFDPYTDLVELKENYHFLRGVDWGVTKGIFSEMYAAQGTSFTKQLAQKGLTSEQSYMNSGYRLQNEEVHGVYEGLKIWTSAYQTAHGRAINPISAPKILPLSGYTDYYEISRILYARDLDLFELLLENPKEAVATTHCVIKDQKPFYDDISAKINLLDHRYGLDYEIKTNLFLKS